MHGMGWVDVCMGGEGWSVGEIVPFFLFFFSLFTFFFFGFLWNSLQRVCVRGKRIGGGGGSARDDRGAIATMMGRFNELRWRRCDSGDTLGRMHDARQEHLLT